MTDLEVDETEVWWHYGENVTLTAQWMVTEPSYSKADMYGLYETPWEYSEAFWAAQSESLSNFPPI